MSADNWAVCPKCAAEKIKAHEKRILDLGKSYGKIPPEEYIANSIEANKPVEHEQTFREDYELGMLPDGEFYVSYSGSCSVCRASFKFEHKARAALAAKPNAR